LTSVHEAAHAVVRVALGMAFESIELCEEGTEIGAQGLMKVQRRPLFGEEFRGAVLSALSSVPAERLLLPRQNQFLLILTTCADDWNAASELCDRHGYDVDRLLRVASTMVRRLATPIFRVADELQRRRCLTYEEVVALCPDVAEEGKAFLTEQRRMVA
jgi:hypothetical protein